MAQTLAASVKPALQVTETVITGLANSNADATLTPNFQYVSGNAATALAINASFIKSITPVTLNSATNTTYTLTALTDDATRSITFANGVKVLFIQITSRTAGDKLIIGGAATNPWTAPFNGANSVMDCPDILVMAMNSTSKYAVTANSSEQLKVSNVGNSAISFRIAILGNNS